MSRDSLARSPGAAAVASATALLALVGACSSPHTPAAREPSSLPRPPNASSTSAAELRPIPHPPRDIVEAPHAGSILMLAATPDGGAVLSVDQLDGARLWPTLDGTREPCVVELPTAVEVALARRGDGFTAAALDEGGGLYVAALDGSGRTSTHVTYGIEPPHAGLAASDRGIVAWRTDHHVIVLGDDGQIVDRIATEPGQRLVDLAVVGARAVAIIERGDERQLRWLAIGPRLAWGHWLPAPTKGKLGSLVALAPDLAYIATVVTEQHHERVVVIDARGKNVLEQVAGAPRDLRFADDRLVVAGGPNGLTLIAVSTSAPPTAPASATMAVTFPNRARQTMAAGGGRVIVAQHSALQLISPGDTQYLGYRSIGSGLTRPGAGGTLFVATESALHLLDRDLRGAPIVTPAVDPRQVIDAQWLADDAWLVESSRKDGLYEVAIARLVAGTRAVVRDKLATSHLLAYEASTQLATLSFGTTPEVGRLDLTSRVLDRVMTVTSSSVYERVQLVPLAPKLARGMQLVRIALGDMLTIAWLTSPTAEPSAQVTFAGATAAVDATGRVYAWRQLPNRKLELVMFEAGKQVGTLDVEGPGSLWPDPSGARFVVVGANGVSLRRRDGTTVWSRDVTGMHSAQWLADGGLALVHRTGIARVDPASGTLTAARCGLDFGLSPQPLVISAPVEPVCEQLAR